MLGTDNENVLLWKHQINVFQLDIKAWTTNHTALDTASAMRCRVTEMLDFVLEETLNQFFCIFMVQSGAKVMLFIQKQQNRDYFPRTSEKNDLSVIYGVESRSVWKLAWQDYRISAVNAETV